MHNYNLSTLPEDPRVFIATTRSRFQDIVRKGPAQPVVFDNARIKRQMPVYHEQLCEIWERKAGSVMREGFGPVCDGLIDYNGNADLVPAAGYESLASLFRPVVEMYYQSMHYPKVFIYLGANQLLPMHQHTSRVLTVALNDAGVWVENEGRDNTVTEPGQYVYLPPLRRHCSPVPKKDSPLVPRFTLFCEGYS
ncbi:MAG: hypothetical protein IT558_02075 [Alphaproteobacteria bacterium]|nr:hypothetical protein [Alphaproteobacteria bacterium]